jgi:hypothetical protein
MSPARVGKWARRAWRRQGPREVAQGKLRRGKLVSESFEADMSPDAYDPVVGQAQQLFENQMRLLLQPLSRFLPFSGRRGR